MAEELSAAEVVVEPQVTDLRPDNPVVLRLASREAEPPASAPWEPALRQLRWRGAPRELATGVEVVLLSGAAGVAASLLLSKLS